MTVGFNSRWQALVRKYSDVILASWHGHLHDDTFRLQMDSDGTAYGVQLCVPSVTTWTQENPRVRLIEYDDESFGLTGWKQYATDIAQDNRQKVISWDLEYDLRSEYGLPSSASVLTPAVFRDLYNRFEADPLLFAKYFLHYHGRALPCTNSTGCWAINLCRVKYSDLEKVWACTQNFTRRM